MRTVKKRPEALPPEELEPGTTYVSSFLWLPRAKVNEAAVRSIATFMVENKRAQQQEELTLVETTPTHLVVPRELFEDEQLPEPVVRYQSKAPDVKFEENIELWPNQRNGWRALRKADKGILNLACGRGKTVLALKKIAYEGKPAAIVVDKTALLEQWKLEATKHLGIKERDIGIIQEDRFEWDRPFVIASIHSLVNRVKAGEVPWAMREHFGIVVFDEVHHLSAPTFILTAPLFLNSRIGLSATPTRQDGLEVLYMSHLGEVFHSDLRQQLTPNIFFIETDTQIRTIDDQKDVQDCTGELNIPRMRNWMGKQMSRNRLILAQIKEAMDKGRNILALSHSKDQVELLNSLVPRSGIITSDIRQKDRLQMLRDRQVTFAITDIAKEGLDHKDLDTVFFLTPFSDENMLQQGIGRALRKKAGKKTPVVVFFWDRQIRPADHMCKSLMREMKRRDWKYRKLLAGKKPRRAGQRPT